MARARLILYFRDPAGAGVPRLAASSRTMPLTAAELWKKKILSSQALQEQATWRTSYLLLSVSCSYFFVLSHSLMQEEIFMCKMCVSVACGTGVCLSCSPEMEMTLPRYSSFFLCCFFSSSRSNIYKGTPMFFPLFRFPQIYSHIKNILDPPICILPSFHSLSCFRLNFITPISILQQPNS